jgi:hypothetical protein
MNLQPIRDLCTKDKSAETWIQDCFSELISIAVGHKAYDSVQAINELLGVLLPGEQPIPQLQLEPAQEAVVIDITSDVISNQLPDYDGAAYRDQYRERSLKVLAGVALKYGDAWTSALQLIPAVERPFVDSGEFMLQPTKRTRSDPNYTKEAMPWRQSIGDVLRAMASTGSLEIRNRSYRLAKAQREIAKHKISST